MSKIEEITIHIRRSEDEDGYMYDIYLASPDEVDGIDSEDGGLCTTTILNALEMANEQTKTILEK